MKFFLISAAFACILVLAEEPPPFSSLSMMRSEFLLSEMVDDEPIHCFDGGPARLVDQSPVLARASRTLHLQNGNRTVRRAISLDRVIRQTRASESESDENSKSRFESIQTSKSVEDKAKTKKSNKSSKRDPALPDLSSEEEPSSPNRKYRFPPPARLPLPTCFYNPSGYVCCNRDMYGFLEKTYNDFINRPGFNPCNIQAILNHVHRESQERYNVTMEGILALDDFAQKVRFRGNFACKIELDGRYLMIYATPVTDKRRKREKREVDLNDTTPPESSFIHFDEQHGFSHIEPEHVDNEHSAFF